jgi:hypothetical protein
MLKSSVISTAHAVTILVGFSYRGSRHQLRSAKAPAASEATLLAHLVTLLAGRAASQRPQIPHSQLPPFVDSNVVACCHPRRTICLGTAGRPRGAKADTSEACW